MRTDMVSGHTTADQCSSTVQSRFIVIVTLTPK